MIRNYAIDGLYFEWHGGMYIDVHREGEAVPFHVINVMDMDGKLLIERSSRGFQRRCNRYIRTGS